MRRTSGKKLFLVTRNLQWRQRPSRPPCQSDVKALQISDLIGVGDCKRGMYRMRILENYIKAMTTMGDIWYKRLGHAPNENLTKIKSLSGFSFNKQCDSCLNPYTQGFLFQTLKLKLVVVLSYCIVTFWVNTVLLYQELVIFFYYS